MRGFLEGMGVMLSVVAVCFIGYYILLVIGPFLVVMTWLGAITLYIWLFFKWLEH